MVLPAPQVPTWLLSACTDLEILTIVHPKGTSIISAILITLGSIPAIPGIAFVAGGTVLASDTAQAIGAVAVSLGQALHAGIESHQNYKPKV